MNNATNCSNLHFSPSLYFTTFLLCPLTLAALATAWICLTLLLKVKTGMLTHNVRFILLYCKIAYLVRCLNLLSKFAYESYLGVQGFSNNSPVSRFKCSLMEMTSQGCVLIPVVTYFFVSLKLLTLTLFGKQASSSAVQWDRQMSHKRVATSNAAYWVAFTALHFLFAADDEAGDDSLICFCYLNFLYRPTVASFSLYATLVTCLTTCALYYLANFINRRRLKDFTNTARTNLNQRFAMWINVRIAKWLLPIVSFQFLMYSFIMVCLKVGHALNGGMPDKQLYTEYISFVFCVVALETLVTPAMIMRNKDLTKLAAKYYPRLWSCVSIRFLLFGCRNKIMPCRTTPAVGETSRSNVGAAAGPDATSVIADANSRRRFSMGKVAVPIAQTQPGQGSAMSDFENFHENCHNTIKVVEYRIKPDQHGAILERTWRHSLSNIGYK
uniref:Uncharacterized protein n=1 Tax=Romanomermis culicivorax TaxID=13658 RepID=A0A915JN51_ROMCU